MARASVVSGVIAAVADKYFVNDGGDYKSSAMFGAACAVGVFLSSHTGNQAPILGLGFLSNGSTIESRILEWTVASGSTLAFNRFALNNYNCLSFKSPGFAMTMAKKAGIVVLSDIVGNAAAEYYNGVSLSNIAAHVF